MRYNYEQALLILEEINERRYKPTSWEIDFLENIENRGRGLNEKQSEALDGILLKAKGEQ